MIHGRGFLSSFAGSAGAASALGFSPKWEALLAGAGRNPGVAFDEYKKGKAAA